MIKGPYDFLMNLNGILKPSKIKAQKVLHIRLNLRKLLNLFIDIFRKYTRSTDTWNINRANLAKQDINEMVQWKAKKDVNKQISL